MDFIESGLYYNMSITLLFLLRMSGQLKKYIILLNVSRHRSAEETLLCGQEHLHSGTQWALALLRRFPFWGHFSLSAHPFSKQHQALPFTLPVSSQHFGNSLTFSNVN